MRAPFVAIELTVFFAAAMTIGADARSWTLDDALGVGFMDDVQLSPDGATALIDVGRADLAHDGFKNVVSTHRSCDWRDDRNVRCPRPCALESRFDLDCLDINRFRRQNAGRSDRSPWCPQA